MSEKIFIEYESLVYNLPLDNNFKFSDHEFVVNYLDDNINSDCIFNNKEPFKVNLGFLSCCMQNEKGKKFYVTVKNINRIEIIIDTESESELYNQVNKIVREQVNFFENILILTTNSHIFLPIIYITIYYNNGSIRHMLFSNNRPTYFNTWNYEKEHINIKNRLEMTINKDFFKKFICAKSNGHYKRAFEYYINSFYESNRSMAFCMLCSAIDSITGNKKGHTTKMRLAKYASVLFCCPDKMLSQKNEMKRLYKLRSEYTHGNNNKIITNKDELILREYVRKFFIAYFHFWNEMGIKSEQEMLKKLDDIINDQSLYIKYVPASFAYMTLMSEHEKNTCGIIDMPLEKKYDIIFSKFKEALAKPKNSQ